MLTVSLDLLLDYTEWQRQKWQEWLAETGDSALSVGSGPHGDGRFGTAGEIVKHIFSAEKRYVDRLSGQPITDTSALPADKAETLFEFGRTSRKSLRELLAGFPEHQWDVPQELKFPAGSVSATPRKIVMHVLLHEIRHWAQIATLLRLNGFKSDFQDFLFSPVLGDPKRGV